MVHGRITDMTGASTDYTTTISVSNLPPAVTSGGAGQAATQGVTTTFGLGSFSDPGANDGPWTVTVNWGDSTASTFTASSLGVLTRGPCLRGRRAFHGERQRDGSIRCIRLSVHIHNSFGRVIGSINGVGHVPFRRPHDAGVVARRLRFEWLQLSARPRLFASLYAARDNRAVELHLVEFDERPAGIATARS